MNILNQIKNRNFENNFFFKAMKNKIARFVIKQHRERFNNDETDLLIKAASRGSNYAIRESKALGLSIKSISGKKIIEKMPNGDIKVIRDLQQKPSVDTGLRKGMVLCRK
ncbi:hypothetical protein [Flavobacterium sp. H4147]|uniref:hypothetical protein n=1 Tax=Flavobacterium sp. H4147 TaxID=3034149 RepID=UPI0023EC772C|nr:hypothetical protein [Flavobacterium sp. H4147]